MEEDEEFFDPRPPIKQKRSAPRCSRFTQIKIKEDPVKTEDTPDDIQISFPLPKAEYTIDPRAIADDIISGKEFKSDDQDLIVQVIEELKSKITDSSKETIEEICDNLEDMREDAEKTKFQAEELAFLELEIGFAKTDYKIFKHKMLAKETDLIDSCHNHIDSLKKKHAEDLAAADPSQREQLMEAQEHELENAETLAEQRIKDFHKFIEAELTPHRSKLQKLKAQQQIAQDKEALWRVKHPVPASKSKEKMAKIIKPKQ